VGVYGHRAGNRVVCLGDGGIGPQLDDTGDRQQTACLKDCIETHERSHIEDVLAEDPGICRDSRAGNALGFKSEAKQKASEIKAYNAEVNCLIDKLPTAGAGCKRIILSRIKDVEKFCDSF
jgi:hypothetical protein